MADCSNSPWASHLVHVEGYARYTDPATIRQVDPNDETLKDYVKASHVVLWANTKEIAISQFPRKAIVLMQMRFDGYIGFPGGLVDEGESPVQGANREMVEEIAYDMETFGGVTDDHFMFCHAVDDKKMLLYFYSKQLTEDQIKLVISNSPQASDFGDESLGLIQVPLYTMCDNYRGLPAFLHHNFVGNAKHQLTAALTKLGILSEDEIKTALSAKPI